MTGLSINKHINSILNGDETLKEMCTSIYPLIAEEDVKFPFILFTRDTMTPIDTKGYIAGDTVDFSIAIVNDRYALTCDIAERVRELLENRHDGCFSRCSLTGCSEGYQDDAYVQRLNFRATILNFNQN